MFKRILLSYDGSEHARHAAGIAAGLAKLQENPLLILVCVGEDVPVEYQEPYRSETIAKRTLQCQALADEAAQWIGEGVEVQRELLFGDPAECVLNVAEANDCDLIVMGTRGVGGLRGLLLGSKAQAVVSHAKCPVLLVK